MEKYWEMHKKQYIVSSLREAIIIECDGRRVGEESVSENHIPIARHALYYKL